MSIKQYVEKLKTYYEQELYSKTKEEQKRDLTYINDTFIVPGVKDPHTVYRKGTGRKCVDAPAEQIVTSNPQAFFDIIKGQTESEERLSKEGNLWLDILKRQNPNPFKQAVKNKLSRGESFIRLVHNESWVSGTKEEVEKGRVSLPVFFLLPDPLVVYASPRDDDSGWLPFCGVPNEVILWYERRPSDVIGMYPEWVRPREKEGDKKVEWIEYWNKNTHFAMADGEVVKEEKHLYPCTPFVRAFSGFGSSSPDGDMSDLVVSDIRYIRGLLEEYYASGSDIASILHKFAHQPITILVPQGNEIDRELIAKEFSLGAYDVNILEVPDGTKPEVQEVPVPSAEMFQYHFSLKAELEQRNPFLRAGFPQGSSGRQQNFSELAAMKRYNTVIENTNTEFATAIEMAFAICKAVPTLKPEGVRSSDLDAKFKCTVKLREEDRLEKSWLVTEGGRLRDSGAIDIQTLHMDFMGFTLEKSRKVQALILRDKLIYESPNLIATLSAIAGKEKNLEVILQNLGTQPPAGAQPPTTKQRIQGEVETPLGQEMVDMSQEPKGARAAPSPYRRGG